MIRDRLERKKNGKCLPKLFFSLKSFSFSYSLALQELVAGESSTSGNDTLLKNGLTPESPSAGNHTNEASESILTCLLKNSSSNLNVQDQNGSTPLHYAAQKGNRRSVKEMLSFEKLDINVS